MTLRSLLQDLIPRLDAAGIPHMLAGSYASAFHGEPRMTMDLDLVIDPDEAGLDRFLASLDPGRFYVDDAHRALAARDQFTVIEVGTQWKADLIIRKDRPFSRVEMSRRIRTEVDGIALCIATAEDTLLAKLEWNRGQASDRQRRDIAGILAISGDHLDWDHLHRWADELGVRAELDEAVRTAE